MSHDHGNLRISTDRIGVQPPVLILTFRYVSLGGKREQTSVYQLQEGVIWVGRTV